jgi:hypothetical protein
MKPLIKKVKGQWMVTDPVVWIFTREYRVLKAVRWCHARNIAEGNYR